jgi:integrase
MARTGAPFELIARQLGHRDVTMVAKVYGRFKPDTEERDRWERIAAARDAENGPAWLPIRLPRQGRTPRKHMKIAPQPLGIARLPMIAGAGLEPATPAL